jgi:hypothetical protein
MPRPRKKLPDARWVAFGKLKKECGLTGSIVIEYNGSGDSGNIERVSWYDGDGAESPPSPSQDRVERAFWDLLVDMHGGWENNDGGQGEITIDFDRGIVDWTHGDNYTETSTTSHDGTFDV